MHIISISVLLIFILEYINSLTLGLVKYLESNIYILISSYNFIKRPLLKIPKL